MTTRKQDTPRWLTAARAGYGVLLILMPGAILRPAGAGHADTRVRGTARLLGLRQLAQASASWRPSPAVLVVGAQVDLAHAVSMFALAACDARRRRLGLLDACAAAGWAALGVLVAQRTQPPDDPPASTAIGPRLRRRRDRLADRIVARTVAALLPPDRP